MRRALVHAVQPWPVFACVQFCFQCRFKVDGLGETMPIVLPRQDPASSIHVQHMPTNPAYEPTAPSSRELAGVQHVNVPRTDTTEMVQYEEMAERRELRRWDPQSTAESTQREAVERHELRRWDPQSTTDLTATVPASTGNASVDRTALSRSAVPDGKACRAGLAGLAGQASQPGRFASLAGPNITSGTKVI